MDYFIPPVDVTGNMWMANPALIGQNNNVQNASEQFSSVFLRAMLKDVFRSQADPFSRQEDNYIGGFSQIVTDSMIDQMAKDDVFGLSKIIEDEVKKSRAGNINL